MALSLENFCKRTLELLELERNEEIEQTRLLQQRVSGKELQRRGLCILQLRIGNVRTGMFGRTVLVMEPFWPGKELPAHSITPGDIVGLSPSQDDDPSAQIMSGVVSAASQTSISVAFDESSENDMLDESAQYRLVKLANDITYRRLKSTVSKLNGYRSGPASHLTNVLFGVSEISSPYNIAEFPFFNSKLDSSQQEAVRFALSQREVAVIHGPPGTGKTTTVVEIIQQAVHQKLKILACAPSNIAVDNLVERVVAGNVRVVRLGHPARLLPEIQRHSLDALLARSDTAGLLQDVKKDMENTLNRLRKVRNTGERQSLRQEMKQLRKEMREREDGAVRDILSRADVVMATLTTAAAEGPIKFLPEGHFDLIIIDECSQAVEAACWTALLQGSRCVLAGDHHQLPPTILSHKAASGGLEKTLMERILEMCGDDVVRMLTVQYRMHADIMQWSSNQLYEGRLTAHLSVAKHLLRDLPGVSDNDDTSIPLLLVDTAGCDLFELEAEEEASKANEGEAEIVSQHVESLIKSGLSAKDIAVIAPYNLQVELLRLHLSKRWPALEIKSVDGFQGREKEAVVISLVRSNEKGEVGFLAEDRRINVAITRARRHLAVICDSDTVSRHNFLKSLVEYITEYGEVRSAESYMQQASSGEQNYELPTSFVASLSRGARPKTVNSGAKQKKTKDKSKTSEVSKESNEIIANRVTKSTKADRENTTVDQEKELAEIISKFVVDDTRSSHKFSPSLTSRERYLVHEIAERFGLVHFSQGDGEERHIVIEKNNTESSHSNPSHRENAEPIEKCALEESDCGSVSISKARNREEKANLVSGNVKEQSVVSEGSSMTTCPVCGRVMPSENLTLHQIRCDRSKPAQQQTTSAQSNENKSKKKKSKKNLKTDVKENVVKKLESEEDFDKLIAMATELNTKCNFKKCKEGTTVLGQNCPFCSMRFCLSHHIPEVHGCGDKAKSHARQLISREGVLYMGSGVPSKLPSAEKKANLQRKMDSRLNKMAEERKHKKKN